MGNLDAKLGIAHAPRLRDYASERCFIVIGVQAKATMRDAAMPFDMGGFHNHQCGAGMGKHPQMHEMPVIGAAIVCGILAHRRNNDAIGEFEVRQAKRREQGTWHGRDSTLAGKRRI